MGELLNGEPIDPYKSLAEAAEFLKQHSGNGLRNNVTFMLGGKTYDIDRLTPEDVKELQGAGLFKE